MYFTKQTLTSRGERVQLLQGDRFRTLEHTFGSIKETKVLNRENYLTNLFKYQVDEIEKHSFFMYLLSQTPRLFLEVIAVVSVSITAILFVLINLPNDQIFREGNHLKYPNYDF